MCRVTVIVWHRPTRARNLQSLIRPPVRLSIHKFLMRSLSCWILKTNRRQCVCWKDGCGSWGVGMFFLALNDNNAVPSFQNYCRASPPNLAFISRKRCQRYICNSCLCVALICDDWLIHESCWASEPQLDRKETLLGFWCSHRTFMLFSSSTAGVCSCHGGETTVKTKHSQKSPAATKFLKT